MLSSFLVGANVHARNGNIVDSASVSGAQAQGFLISR